MFLQVSLNGSRTRNDHPVVPVTPLEMAQDIHKLFLAGARSVHLHARNNQGKETLDPDSVAESLTQVRAVCPEIELALSTAEYIVGNPRQRLDLLAAWSVLPDTLCVNLSEEGIDEVIALAQRRGISLEAGLFTPADVLHLRSLDHVEWKRILLEPLSTIPGRAEIQLALLEEALGTSRLAVPHVIHGMEDATYPLLRRAAVTTQASRIGFEDTLILPDGSLAADNVDLYQTGLSLMGEAIQTHAQR